jgi:hypothetical protein
MKLFCRTGGSRIVADHRLSNGFPGRAGRGMGRWPSLVGAAGEASEAVDVSLCFFRAASVGALGHGRMPGSYEELVAAR